eukprot:689768-Pleurochrysis_carterae.AAC.2
MRVRERERAGDFALEDARRCARARTLALSLVAVCFARGRSRILAGRHTRSHVGIAVGLCVLTGEREGPRKCVSIIARAHMCTRARTRSTGAAGHPSCACA